MVYFFWKSKYLLIFIICILTLNRTSLNPPYNSGYLNKSLKIPKGLSKFVYRRRTDNTMAKRRRTDNTMAKRKSTKGQTTIYKTYI